MTQRYLRPILWGLLATAALLTVMACGPLERLQQPREGQTPSQVPQELSVLWEVWQTLEEDFGGEQSIDQRSLSEGAIQGMVDALGDGDHAYITAEDYDLDAPDLGAVWQAWQAMWERLEVVDTKVTPEELQQAAIRGMLEALGNPYTTYLTPANYELEFQSFNSSFEGIGAYVGISNEQLTVVAPIPEAPAEIAGLVAGDVILEVDGTPITGLTLPEATLRIRGPQGTPVDLLVLHPGQETPEIITIVRDKVERMSVRWQPLTDDVAYMWISQFVDHTDEEVEEALRDIVSEGFDGLILDVRYNLGGLLDTTVSVASQFLKDGLVLYVVDGHGIRTDMAVRGGGVATEIPMVVLTNGSSASSSEVLVGALQDHQRATIIGTTTFGKGSVNRLRKLNDGSGLYLTSALWYTPEGRTIEGEGLNPDIVVPMDFRIPLGSAFDRQLSAALDYLQEQIPSPVS